jgi:hypothetical protein
MTRCYRARIVLSELAFTNGKVRSAKMSETKRHRVEFAAHKTVKEPTEVAFRTKAGERVDFMAKKPVKEVVEVSFFAREKKQK